MRWISDRTVEWVSTNCFSWKSGTAQGANCPVQKENANIPIFNPIISLEIPARNFQVPFRAGYAHSAWAVLCDFTSSLLHFLGSGRWLQGEGHSGENASLQVEDDKLFHQMGMRSGRNGCRGLWDVSQNSCEKVKSWSDCYRMDFIALMVSIF